MIIAVGDGEQKKHRKYKERRKGKRMRDVLRRAGCNVGLVDEYRTIASCSGSERDQSERAEKKGKRIHGLLVWGTCSKLWRRDYNAARNIARADLNNDKRPSCLCRIRGER